MIYKNMTHTTKTFYGVQFKPGEEHDVPGYINYPNFERVAETAKKTTTKTTKKEVTSDGTDSN